MLEHIRPCGAQGCFAVLRTANSYAVLAGRLAFRLGS
jgi:hypothetical protein